MKRLFLLLAGLILAGTATATAATPNSLRNSPTIGETVQGIVHQSIAPVVPRVRSHGAATSFGNFDWNASWGGWVDYRCGTTGDGIDMFHLYIYEDSNENGHKTKICAAVNDWCTVPMTGANSYPTGQTCIPYINGRANDVVSSAQLTTIVDTLVAVHLYEDSYWGGNRTITGLSWSCLGNDHVINDLGNAYDQLNDEVSSDKAHSYC